MENDYYRSRFAGLEADMAWPRNCPVVWGDVYMPGYERLGFCILPGFFSQYRIERLRQAAITAAAQIPEPGSQAVKTALGVHETPAVLELAKELAPKVRGILGGDVYLHQSRINYKHAGGSTGWGWHSDFETWHCEDGMPMPRALTAMIPLVANTPDNGPLLVIPGSHGTYIACPGDTPSDSDTFQFQNQKVGVPSDETIRKMSELFGDVEPVLCEPGDVVLFDSNLLHGSEQNNSPFDRTNLFLVFNSVENRLREPFAASRRRSEYAATRTGVSRL